MANTYQTSGDLNKRQQYEMLCAELRLDRSSFDAHYRMLADFVKPRRLRAYVTDKGKGDRRNQSIIDSTATLAHQVLISGLHTGMTNPSTQWFALGCYDPQLEKWPPVKKWLHDVTEILLSAILKSNAYTSFPILYGDESLFATAGMGVMEDARDLFRCYPYPIGTYWIGVDERGVASTFMREYQLTVRNLVKQFGRIPGTRDIDWSHLSPTVKKLWDNSEYETNVDVCWIVSPNEDRDSGKLDSKYLPWFSCHFEKGQDQDGVFLRESGFNEFPIIAPRWSVVAEDSYGTDSPGIAALGDIRALQVMTKRKAQGVEKMVNPPLQAPTSAKTQKVSLLAGDVTYIDVLQHQQGIRPIHDLQLPVDHIRLDIGDTRQLIDRNFYVDLFRMITVAAGDRRQITAREIDERHEEKLMALAPVVERNNDECHKPFIDRVYSIMDRAGRIPPAPKELQGVALKVTYLSALSRALKMVGISGLNSYVQSALAVAQIAPETKHKTNWLKVLDEYGDGFGVHPDVVRTDDDAMALIQQEQQAIQQAQQAELAALAAKGTRDLSQSNLEGDNALTRMANHQ